MHSSSSCGANAIIKTSLSSQLENLRTQEKLSSRSELQQITLSELLRPHIIMQLCTIELRAVNFIHILVQATLRRSEKFETLEYQ